MMDNEAGIQRNNLSYREHYNLYIEENIQKYEFLREVMKQETGGYTPFNAVAWFISQFETFNDGQPLAVEKLQAELASLKLPDIDPEKIDINDPRFREWNETMGWIVSAEGIIKLKLSTNPQIQAMVEDLEQQALDLWKVKKQQDQIAEEILSGVQSKETIKLESSEIQDKKALPLGEVVIDFSNRDNRLGFGAMGEVWKGTIRGGFAALRGQDVIDHKNETVAVKIPSTMVKMYDGDAGVEHQENSLKKEGKILRLLRDTGAKLFPSSPSHFCDAEMVTVNGQTGMVMEFIDPHCELYNQIGAKYTHGEPLTLTQFQSALNQYFEVLKIVHSLGFTCNDRKEGDFYYLSQGDRLVVLDWGTLHIDAGQKGTESYDLAVLDHEPKEHNRRRVSDLYTGVKSFARFYKELLKSQPANAGFSSAVLANLEIITDQLRRMDVDYPTTITNFPSTESIAELIHRMGKTTPEEFTQVLKG